MERFDYSNNSVIGYVDIKLNGNAFIDVLGYLNQDNEFIRLEKSKSLDLFPYRGKVFAFGFSSYYYDLNNEIVCLTVRPDNKVGTNQEYYVWDRTYNIYPYGRKLFKINGIIDGDANNIISVLTKNNLLTTSKDEYVYSYDRIYLVKRELSDRTLSYWNTNRFNIVEYAGNKYLLGTSSMPAPDGKVDISTDDQLLDWFMSKVLKKQWAELVTSQNFMIVESQIREILQNNKSLDQDILEERFNRILKIKHTFELTLSTLRDFSETPSFKASFEKALEKYREELIGSKIKTNDEEYKKLCNIQENRIQELLESTNSRVKSAKEKICEELKLLEEQRSDIYREIDDAKTELDIAKEELLTKRKEVDSMLLRIEEIEKRKEDLLKDFSIIKDVLSLTDQSVSGKSQRDNSKRHLIKSVGTSEKPMDSLRVYRKLLYETFEVNDVKAPEIDNLLNTIVHCNILLVPSAAYARIIMFASKRFFYLAEYVSAGWKSFDDLLANGLSDMYEDCVRNSDVMHYLLLQNINLSYIPNYMQPLIDIQNRVIDEIPGINKPFPKNLRIICTISDDTLIPLSRSSIMSMGCVQITDNDILKPIVAAAGEHYGYLTPQLLDEQKVKNADVINYYDQYLNG